MHALTSQKGSNNPQSYQAYLTLQPDWDPNLDLEIMQTHLAAIYEAFSKTVDAKYLRCYMTVLTNFTLATSYAKQDVPKKKKQLTPAGRLSRWVRASVSRKTSVDHSDVKTFLATNPCDNDKI